MNNDFKQYKVDIVENINRASKLIEDNMKRGMISDVLLFPSSFNDLTFKLSFPFYWWINPFKWKKMSWIHKEFIRISKENIFEIMAKIIDLQLFGCFKIKVDKDKKC